MITLKSCPNCKSSQVSEYRILSGGDLIVEITPGVKVNAIIITRYCVCQDCRLIFQNPRLSDAELDIYYGSGNYRSTINQPPEGMDKGEENRAKLDAEIIKRVAGEVNSHLDIGCGHGYLLEVMGAKIKVGTESDLKYVKAKYVKVYADMDKIPQKKFDLVTAIHVLEHLPYPLDFLKKMAEFVEKDGHLVIEVPSWRTRGGPLGFAHLHHFETDVLKLMCVQVGLTVIQTEFTPHLMLICKADNN
ncbi:MAG: Methylase/methyltransferase [Candidatus Gottesmanbacteria bacterium GW2011_GWA2_47_9]|uniref:Methylase/methyltransferase n=1 Tax=Candidatus Gottesmanbacteria bacterium GW2011_GWA2_47_9 TaxID=1618445 RepID=A0A0G1U1Y2_9BACT|nr:MAG: Methylase/methyltransferase [Candidatus Gottesmanbacteria bacterium GW2011_GWA2_47_9]